jgi:hypothetical protein
MSKFARTLFNLALGLSLVVTSSLAQDGVKTGKDATISIATVRQIAAEPETFDRLSTVPMSSPAKFKQRLYFFATKDVWWRMRGGWFQLTLPVQ